MISIYNKKIDIIDLINYGYEGEYIILNNTNLLYKKLMVLY